MPRGYFHTHSCIAEGGGKGLLYFYMLGLYCRSSKILAYHDAGHEACGDALLVFLIYQIRGTLYDATHYWKMADFGFGGG